MTKIFLCLIIAVLITIIGLYAYHDVKKNNSTITDQIQSDIIDIIED